MQSYSFSKAIRFLLILTLVNITSVASLYAQATSVSAANDTPASAKSAQTLIDELEQNERALFALFNTLNSSDDNDIVCSTSNLEENASQRQLCEPVFLEELRQEVEDELARSAESENGFFARVRNIFTSKEERSKKLLLERAAAPVERLQQEIESLAEVHPNLLAQLQTIGELQQAYLQTVEAERLSGAYLMRQNEASYNQGFNSGSQAVGGKPWFSAPPPGHTTPRIHFGHPDFTTK